MRFIVATDTTNGSVSGDFTHCVEGELVVIDEPCDGDRADPGGKCGCGRSFSGLSSHRATTTARVVELSLTEAEVREAIRSSREAGGWLDPSWCPPGLAQELVDEVFDGGRHIAEHFPVGTVLGRWADDIYARVVAPAS